MSLKLPPSLATVLALKRLGVDEASQGAAPFAGIVKMVEC